MTDPNAREQRAREVLSQVSGLILAPSERACVIRAMLAFADAQPQEGAGVPAGMKPWAGGDSAPEDWDGGPVLTFDDTAPRKHQPQIDGAAGANRLCWSRNNAFIDIIAYTPTPSAPAAPVLAEVEIEREALTPAQLDAIVSALSFCLAGEWDDSSHDHAPAVYERALAKVQRLNGRVLKGGLRVALDEANQAFHASDYLAKNAERRCTELAAKVDELERALASLPSAQPADDGRESEPSDDYLRGYYSGRQDAVSAVIAFAQPIVDRAGERIAALAESAS